MPTCLGLSPESIATRDEDQINTKLQKNRAESVWDLRIVFCLLFGICGLEFPIF